MNIELYINKQLCDIGDPEKFSLYLKRVFISPSELSTKNAQCSYTITLPATAINNSILGSRNVEEVRGKFALIFDALLVVGGVTLLKGKFRLSEITSDSYIGNLGIPAPKTIKEIFGDTNVANAGEWIVNFGDFKSSVERFNSEDNPPCFFPYVLYGLLPKIKKDSSNYSNKNEWDNTVVIGLDDLPPSINCLEAVKQLFKNKDLNITGSAFDDEGLRRLYMSYSNPTEYEIPWNYGRLGEVEVEVKWKNHYSTNNRGRAYKPDYSMVKNPSPFYYGSDSVYVANLLSSPCSSVTITDKGFNVLASNVTKKNLKPYTQHSIIIPHSGIYKIDFTDVRANRIYDKRIDNIYKDNVDDIEIIASAGNNTENYFIDNHFEIKLIRDKGEGTFDLSNMDIDRRYYRDNMNQTTNFDYSSKDGENSIISDSNYPKYYPRPGDTAFIDPKVNSRLLCGLSFGGSRCFNNNDLVSYYVRINPDNLNNSIRFSNVIAIKGGYSWDTKEEDFIVAATPCTGYVKLGFDYSQSQPSWNKDDCKYRVDGSTIGSNYATLVDTQGTYPECKGEVHQLVWLEKGERITIIVCAESTRWGRNWGMPFMEVHAKLKITPYKMDKSWLEEQLNHNGESTGEITYNVEEEKNADFKKDSINLMKFLPSDKKVDDWLNNFCKAFNLQLTFNDDDKMYHLDIKQRPRRFSSSIIDLDNRANVTVNRTNSSMGIPSEYKIGFTTNANEEGYVRTDKTKSKNYTDKEKNKMSAEERYESGGGTFKTGSPEIKTIEQTSNFSYCWYKDIKIDGKDYSLPVISDKEVWGDSSRDYEKMMVKDYSNKPQRFWYKKGTVRVPGLGGKNGSSINVATVSNELEDRITLDYHDKPNSIMNNYFALFTNADNAFTTVECYLTPAEYAALEYSFIKLNGDIYYPAEIDAFDPLQRKPCKLKLIRKLL